MMGITNIETKVKAGTLTSAATGIIVWALVSFVPAFKDGVPETLRDAIPFILTAVGGAIASYLAPHTSRPDLRAAKPSPAIGEKAGGGAA
jgi:hypothetical protein